MKTIFKKYRQLIFAIIGGLATVITAWFGKDTQHENAFFYVFCIWLILYSILEVYLKKKKDH